MGYVPTRDGVRCAKPVTAVELMDFARGVGLGGIEVPVDPRDVAALEALREAALSRGMRIIPDYMVLVDTPPAEFVAFLNAAKQLGATVVRALISRVLCGDRRKLQGGWEARLEATARRLRELLPIAQDLGLCIAIENHQDATTDDLLRLHEMAGSSPALGVCVDTGNPLSVGEDPLESAGRLAPIIRHVHLKDYTIHFAPEGYRLVRCAAGEGVIDFRSILSIVRSNGHAIMPGIEIAWQETRTIPVLDHGWWAQYPAREAADFVNALKVLWEHGRSRDEPYSSAWERGECSDTICAEEWDLVRRSCAYFARLVAAG